MSTHKLSIKAEPAALLLWSLFWFFDESGLFSAFLPAVALHEAGHILALRLCGIRLRSLRLGLWGLELDHFGLLSGPGEALSLLAGPAAGLLWAALLTLFPGRCCGLGAGLSLGLSLFNLLPVLPLDGGRLLCLAFPRWGRGLSLAFSGLLAAGGVWLLLRLRSPLPLCAAGWLLALNVRYPE